MFKPEKSKIFTRAWRSMTKGLYSFRLGQSNLPEVDLLSPRGIALDM
jgi:hypothetical protein